MTDPAEAESPAIHLAPCRSCGAKRFASEEELWKRVPHLKSRLPEEPDKARKAFLELCNLRCCWRCLGTMFLYLAQTEPLKLSVKTRTGEKPSSDKPQKVLEIYLNPLDSWGSLLYPVTKEELERIAARAKRLRADVRRLRKTRLARHLALAQPLPDDDLLGGPPFPRFRDRVFESLIELPEIIKRFSPRQRPDYTRRLTAIYEHIHERTRRWHDSEVADILHHLTGPTSNPDAPYTAQGLKQWRRRHGLTG